MVGQSVYWGHLVKVRGLNILNEWAGFDIFIIEIVNKTLIPLLRKILFHIPGTIVMLMMSVLSIAQTGKQVVRMAVIEVDSLRVKEYNVFLKDEIEASIRLEPGVITLYAIAQKEKPELVTLFETYADSVQYKSHIGTPHFQKYKKGTSAMVEDLQLIEATPIFYIKRNELETASIEKLVIRLVKIELDSNSIKDFYTLATRVMLPNVKKEAGVLIMYSVAEKLNPALVTILEVYRDEDSYNHHLTTPHFLRYRAESQKMIRSVKFIDVEPVLLGAKPVDN